MRTFLLVLISFIVGAAAAVGGGFWALSHGYVPGFGAPLVQPVWPDVKPANGDAPAVPDDPSISGKVLPVPRTAASEQFQKALQDTVTAHNTLAATGVLLVDKLNEMNSRSTSRNFDGFFDLVFDAKMILAEQVSETKTLAGALGNLEKELPSISDPTLGLAAGAMVVRGKALVAVLNRYSAAVEPVLSGKVPNQETINGVFTAATELQSSSKDFNAAAEATAAAIRALLDAAPILKTQAEANAAR